MIPSYAPIVLCDTHGLQPAPCPWCAEAQRKARERWRTKLERAGFRAEEETTQCVR